MAKNKAYPDVPGTVIVGGDIHCKSQEALDNVLAYLSEDYEIKDCSKDETHPHEGYFASLKKSVCETYCKCDYCGHYSTRNGSKCHGYKCDGCGKVLYREYLPKSPIRISLHGDRSMKYLNFIIHSYDEENERILVYAKVLPSKQWFSVHGEKAEALLKEHRDAYEVIDVPGKGYKLLSFYYPTRGYDRKSKDVKISIHEVGHPPYKKVPNKDRWSGYDYVLDEEDRKCHYTSVQLYKGQEIVGDMGWDLPVHDTYMIYPTFKHSPEPRDANLSRRIIHAARQVADCGYYYQDGREAFGGVVFDWMTRYVEHFTDLDVNRFKRFIKIARRDGPGFISDLGTFIGKETGVKQNVENRPNVFNAIIGVSKAMSGERLSDGEYNAMKHAFSDRKTLSEYEELMGSLAERGKS